MLEEYLCLGGTEIANNARTYGYATTSGCPVSWFRCEPCDSILAATNDWVFPVYKTIEYERNLATNPSWEHGGGAVTVRRNMATNPSFEATTAATQEVRRNLALTPSLYPGSGPVAGWNLSGRWFGGGTWAGTVANGVAVTGPTGTGITTAQRKTYTAVSGGGPDDFTFSLNHAARVPVVAGEVYTVSFYIKPSWNLGPNPVQNNIHILAHNVVSGGTPVSDTAGPTLPVPAANVWTRLSRTYTVPAGATFLEVYHEFYSDKSSSSYWPIIGSTIDATGLLVEKSPIVGTFFEGRTLPAGDFTQAWGGTADASASIQYGVQVPDATSVTTTIIGSQEWASSGVRSVRLIAPGWGQSDTYASIGGDVGGVRLGMVPGKTYTILATLRMKAPLTERDGPAHTRARGINVHFRVGGTYSDVNSTQPPNSPGVYPQRLTFTVPAGATECFVRLYNGSASRGDEVWWDDFLLVEGVYNGPYFDGSTPAKVRRNFVLNPGFDDGTQNNTGNIGAGGATNAVIAGAARSGAFGLRRTATVAGGGGGWGNHTGSLPPGRYVASWYIRSSVDKGDVSTYIQGTSTRVNIANSGVTTLVAGQWTRQWTIFDVTVAGTAQPGSNVAIANIGDYLDYDDWLVEMIPGATGVAQVGSYFDGSSAVEPWDAAWEGTASASPSYLYDGDFTYAWDGTPNASTSQQKGDYVSQADSANQGYSLAAVVRSTDWSSNRTHSLRIIPVGVVVNGSDTGATVAGGAGGMSGYGVTFVAGRTYTVSATIRLLAPQDTSGEINIRARRIHFADSILGWDNPAYMSAQAPNAAGETRLTLTFTVHPAATWAILRLYNGGTPGNDVWWDELIITEGTNTVAYFDGDSAEPTDRDDIFWAGTPDLSASIWERQILDTPGHVDANPYESQYIADAPWYDADVEASSRFFGPFLITVENLNSSTRTATVTEGILDGGVVGLTRHATREMRVRALLVADGEDALEYGLAWLNAALETTDCQTHGSACGAVDMQFFAYCPDAPDPNAPPDNDGSDVWDAEIRAPRYMHNVTVISGPLVEQKIKSNNERHIGYIVEWTMVAGTPWVFSTTTEIGLNPTVPTVIQDEPFNLMPYPSAELASGTVIVQTNYVTNPSFETNIADWSVSGDAPIPASGGVVGSRSTDVSASGLASLRARFTATAGGTGGTIYAMHTAPIPAGTGRRVSITAWLFAAVASGTAVLGDRLVNVLFQDAAGAQVGSILLLGPAVVSGGVLSATSVSIPDNVAKVAVIPHVRPTSWSTGAVIDLYVDAVAVTIP